MKKLFYFVFIVLCTIACNNDDCLEAIISHDNSKVTELRSYDEALQVALDGIKILEGRNIQTRSQQLVHRELDLTNGVSYIVNHKTRSSETASGNDTLMYVFNFMNDKGFAIVSANPNTDGLLAVTESGHYDSEARNSNSGFGLFMDMAEEYVRNSTRGVDTTKHDVLHMMEDYRMVYDTIESQVGPLVHLCWGQDNCYGQYCPNQTSGCAITAAAMAMAYFKYPAGMTFTYSGRDMNYQSFDWDDIQRHYSCRGTFDLCYAYNQDSVHNSIGRLCRQLGELADASYNINEIGPNETKCNSNDIRRAIETLGYHVGSITQYSPLCIKNNLTSTRLMIMFGHDQNNKGHAWLAEGYHYVKYIQYEEQTLDYGLTWTMVPRSRRIEETMLNYINWGWNGDNNGYFNDGVFDVSGFNYNTTSIGYFTIYR